MNSEENFSEDYRARWFKLIRNSAIFTGSLAAIISTFTIVDHVSHHKDKHDPHLEKIRYYKPLSYTEIDIITKTGDTIKALGLTVDTSSTAIITGITIPTK